MDLSNLSIYLYREVNTYAFLNSESKTLVGGDKK